MWTVDCYTETIQALYLAQIQGSVPHETQTHNHSSAASPLF